MVNDQYFRYISYGFMLTTSESVPDSLNCFDERLVFLLNQIYCTRGILPMLHVNVTGS